ncbi:MAG TPA: DUF2786 domain-containing protein [Streptosporangiaceae bacterium]|nr:DUF2786 domain-containing protein [Streptosporangiaceae bacterium]
MISEEAAPPEAPDRLLERVRKLLAKAGDESVTPPEAQALTAKAAELMAKYGIDRALLAADQPETDRPADRIVSVENPWGRVKAHLLTGLASAMRCQCVLLPARDGMAVHIFGFASDLERADLLYTSLLVQMWHGLMAAPVPEWASSPRAWRRSWLLGFASSVVGRVRAAEEAAAGQAPGGEPPAASRTALVLADRTDVIREHVGQAYPRLRRTRITYSGSGYGAGWAQGQRADIGTARVARPRGRALSGQP